MDQVLVIRHKVLVEKRSVRTVAREHGVSRNTVKRYVAGAAVGVRVASERKRPVTERVQQRALELLAESPKWTTPKQRLTAMKLRELLQAEGLAAGRTVVQKLVREWRRQRREVFVPLTYRAGDLGQVDFFEVVVDVDGERRKAFMFVMRLMHSGADFAWLYPRQDQVCFLDGHVRAFEHFGAVPHRLQYDNLRAAVAKMLVGSERALTARFAALSSHYLFEACFSRPRTGHDKGGVEARGKGIRLQELVPIPSGADLARISASLLARIDARLATATDGETAQRLADERAAMLPLPGSRFEPAQLRIVTATRRSLVQLEGGAYSVWSRWAGLAVNAYVGVDTIAFIGPDGARVEHPRVRFGGRSVDYSHYLPELARKPQALRQVADELVPRLGEPFSSLWRQLVDEHGPKQAARVFAKVLDAIVERGVGVVALCVAEAVRTQASVLLALAPPSATAPPLERVPASLAGYEVTAGAAADYDTLLAGAR